MGALLLHGLKCTQRKLLNVGFIFLYCIKVRVVCCYYLASTSIHFKVLQGERPDFRLEIQSSITSTFYIFHFCNKIKYIQMYTRILYSWFQDSAVTQCTPSTRTSLLQIATDCWIFQYQKILQLENLLLWQHLSLCYKYAMLEAFFSLKLFWNPFAKILPGWHWWISSLENSLMLTLKRK